MFLGRSRDARRGRHWETRSIAPMTMINDDQTSPRCAIEQGEISQDLILDVWRDSSMSFYFQLAFFLRKLPCTAWLTCLVAGRSGQVEQKVPHERGNDLVELPEPVSGEVWNAQQTSCLKLTGSRWLSRTCSCSAVEQLKQNSC